MINIAVYLYDTYLIAARIAEIILDYVIGSGVIYTCDYPDAKAVIDNFWTDPINNWPLYQSEAVIDLCVYGEQCWPVFIDDNTGKVRLGYIDPGNISKVITDPGNVKLKRKGGYRGINVPILAAGTTQVFPVPYINTPSIIPVPVGGTATKAKIETQDNTQFTMKLYNDSDVAGNANWTSEGI